jgi:hypothetical protein
MLTLKEMKKILKRSIILTGLIISANFMLFSQIGDIANLLAGGVNDAELMLTEYIRPAANALGSNLSAGWYNTADVHKLGGFHLNLTVSAAFAPEEHQTYNLDELELSDNIRYDYNMAKTAAGTAGSETQIWYVADLPVIGEQEVVRYDHPGGSGYNMLPSPMINAGVGLIKGTEILGRYMPTLKYGADKTNSIGLWGIGIQHDLKQWIPVLKSVPVLNLSIMYGYTRVNFHSSLTPLTPEILNAADLTTTADWNTQNMDMQVQGHTANLLVGASLPIVSFYGGAGVSITQTNLNLNGDFPVPSIVSDVAAPNFGEVVVTDSNVATDPFNIEIKNQDGGTTKPRFNIGMRFKFSVITIHVDYTWANYSVATIGFGISFR